MNTARALLPQRNDIDTEVLGIPVARARISSPEEIGPTLAHCRTMGTALLVARCPVDTVQTAQALSAHGFVMTDTLIYYSSRAKRAFPLVVQSEIPVREVRKGEEQVVGDIARVAFKNYSSHYHADPRLDPRKCDEIYAHWAYRACLEMNDDHKVIVAEGKDGGPIGFGILRLNQGRECEALLAGVHPSSPYSGAFVYRALLWEGSRIAVKCGASRAITSTQINNVLIQKLWTKAGWIPDHALYTFHKWLDR